MQCPRGEADIAVTWISSFHSTNPTCKDQRNQRQRLSDGWKPLWSECSSNLCLKCLAGFKERKRRKRPPHIPCLLDDFGWQSSKMDDKARSTETLEQTSKGRRDPLHSLCYVSLRAILFTPKTKGMALNNVSHHSATGEVLTAIRWTGSLSHLRCVSCTAAL